MPKCSSVTQDSSSHSIRTLDERCWKRVSRTYRRISPHISTSVRTRRYLCDNRLNRLELTPLCQDPDRRGDPEILNIDHVRALSVKMVQLLHVEDNGQPPLRVRSLTDQVVRRQKAIAEKEEVTRAKAKALEEKKRAEKKAALDKKKVRYDTEHTKYICTVL